MKEGTFENSQFLKSNNRGHHLRLSMRLPLQPFVSKISTYKITWVIFLNEWSWESITTQDKLNKIQP